MAGATAQPAARAVRPHLPPGTELDRRDGSAWCSLVGFQFLDTRVLGVGWPGFRHFPEWNLRFYVRRGDERGGAAALQSPGQRFGFLKAPRSTVLQPGPVHGGVTEDPARQLERLLEQLVG